ncbi:MAG: MotA/TolQ/ExbB proton channel family protein [Dichotomicrobium sp.]
MSENAPPEMETAPLPDGGATAPVAQPLTDTPSDTPGFLSQYPILERLDFSGLNELVAAGGPVTAILLALSVVTLTVILAKLWQFQRADVGRSRKLRRALDLWSSGHDERAINQLHGARGAAARVAEHAMTGLMSRIPEARVREDAERLAMGELSSLRSYLRVIEMTVQTAPLLGLFGTVLGMIASFQALEGAGAQADPAVLAGGIWVALLTTAVGLAIAIPAAFALTWFQGRIEREQDIIEDTATSIFTRRLALQSEAERSGVSADAGWPVQSQRREAL